MYVYILFITTSSLTPQLKAKIEKFEILRGLFSTCVQGEICQFSKNKSAQVGVASFLVCAKFQPISASFTPVQWEVGIFFTIG